MEYNTAKGSEKKVKEEEKLEKMAKKCLEKKDALIKANDFVQSKLFEMIQTKEKEKEKESVRKLEEKNR
jgi:hypothetical protein